MCHHQGNAYEYYCRNISNYCCACRYDKQANILLFKDITLADFCVNLPLRLVHTHTTLIVILRIHGRMLAK
jgi:hypothetical protein